MTNYQLITNYQLPITNYQLPITQPLIAQSPSAICFKTHLFMPSGEIT
ncbi:hypothetical protein [Microcoleus sp. PH2017_25_DOB_D_A]